jgi:DNA (cytosine-5)-methyltransferase 1
MKSYLTYIDLFSGAGGMSEGFLRAGFVPIAHVEHNKAACFTLKTRMAFYYLKKLGEKASYYSYLKGEISRKEFYSNIPSIILDSVINAEIGRENLSIFRKIDSFLNGNKVDLIIGGPPCQAYSYLGRAALKHKWKDERNTLYVHYGRFLKKYNPKVFVFENVPGLFTAGDGIYFNNLKKYYKRLGYNIEAKQFNSYDHNVIQNRVRVIIIGWKKNIKFEYPILTNSETKFLRDDIFYDLPAIKPGNKKKFCNYLLPPNEYLKKTEIRDGINFVTQHISRSHNERDLKIYKIAIQKLSEGIYLKNNKIPPEIRTQNNLKDFLDRFKVVGNIPHTMIAHIAKDGHHFIHPDINQLRSISVREAARIQSFPDDYYFEGFKEDKSRTAAFKQIGNAVPPLFAEKIAKGIFNQLSIK